MIKFLSEYIKLLLLFLIDLIERLQKFVVFVWYRKHEVERICESETDIYDKSMRVGRWLDKTRCREIQSFMSRNFPSPSQNTRNLASKAVERILASYKYVTTATLRTRSKTELNDETEDIDIILNSQLRDSSRELFKNIIKTKRLGKAAVKRIECLEDILYRILSYRLTIMVAEQLAATKYDPDFEGHTERLISLWNNLIHSDKEKDLDSPASLGGRPAFPKELSYEISRKSDIVSSRWSHIGFQGEDPGTDFRGMGLLGLVQLEYLARKPKKLPTDLLKRSHNEQHGYPFAIVGINITYNLLSLFKDGSMKHLYYDEGDVLFRNKQRVMRIIRTFNDLYVELFLRFDCFWHESKPQTIFEFKALMEKFVDIVRVDLNNRNFTMKFIY